MLVRCLGVLAVLLATSGFASAQTVTRQIVPLLAPPAWTCSGGNTGGGPSGLGCQTGPYETTLRGNINVAGNFSSPTYSSGGGGSATLGAYDTNSRFRITTSATASTSVAATFSAYNSWPSAPACWVNPEQSTTSNVQAVATSTVVTISWTGSVSSAVFDVLCVGSGGRGRNNKGIQSFNGGPESYPQSYVNAMIARWQSIGVAWVRLPVWQPDLDPSCSGILNFSTPLVAGGYSYDALIAAFVAAGIEPLMLVGETAACSSTTGGTGWIPPANPSTWATNFAAKVAAHEGPLGHHNYEIWNEENGVWDWPPTVSASQYVTLLCDVYSAVHAQDTSANVIVGGLSGTQGTTVLDTTYLTQMYSAGAHGCFDAIADHPYPDNGPTNNVLRGGTNNWDRMYFTTPSLQSIMAANGDGSKKIWVTETGCATAGQSLTNGFQITACPDQTHQAQMITDAFNFSTNGFPNLGPIIWWEDHDTAGATCNATTPSDPLDVCAGLWDGNLAVKSAVAAYASASGIW